MNIKSKVVAGTLAGCAALVVSTAPASAASGPSYTVTTDAGTSCTITSDYTVRAPKGLGGLFGSAPIAFNGDLACSLADQANAPVSYSGLNLNSGGSGGLLGLGGFNASGQLNSPPNTDIPPTEEGPVPCRMDPGYDCGRSGQTNGQRGKTYKLTFGAGFVAPEGERWTGVLQGCRVYDDAIYVECPSISTFKAG